MAGDEQRNLHSPWTFDITREFTTWVVFIYLHGMVVTHSGQMNGDWHRYDAIIETYQLLREERKAFFRYRPGLDVRRGGAKE